jgi:hypothetical protein
LFATFAVFYKKTVNDCKLTYKVVLLAPEILMSIILGLAFLDQLVAAFLFMLGSIVCLAILAVAISIRGLNAVTSSSSAEEDDCKELLQEKLDVGHLNGGRSIIRTIQIV